MLMKPEPIRKSVTNSRHERSAGDAPDLGRVSKMPGAGLPKGEKRMRKRGAHRAKGTGGKIASNWVLLIGILILLVAGVFIFKLVRSGKSKTEGPITKRLVVDGLQLGAPKDSGMASPSEAEALALVKTALAVRDVAQVPRYFESVSHSAEEIVAFLAGLEASEGKITDYSWLSNMNTNGLILEGVLVRFNKDDKNQSRIVFLKPEPQAGWRVEFESFARIESPSWNDLVEGKVDQAQVRVFLVADSYYNGPFSDEKIWACYAISNPDSKEMLQGYCRIGSPQAAAIRTILSKGQRANRVTLELKRVPEGLEKQVEITRIIAEDWVISPEPLDQKF